MEKYMAEYSAVNKAPRSHIRDQESWRHLIKFFGDYMIVEITPKIISEYKTKRRQEGASPRTLNYELTLMSHAFNLAIREWEWVRENPVRRVSKERVNNQRERWLTLEEEEKLLAASPKWLTRDYLFCHKYRSSPKRDS